MDYEKVNTNNFTTTKFWKYILNIKDFYFKEKVYIIFKKIIWNWQEEFLLENKLNIYNLSYNKITWRRVGKRSKSWRQSGKQIDKKRTNRNSDDERRSN